MKNIGNKTTLIASTIFATLALIGFAFPIFASSLPGAQIVQTKITVGDTSQPFAIADTNYLQGGHMQVSGVTDMYAITPERRSLGMLVSVIDTSTSTAGNQTVTYRLFRNPVGGGGCPTTSTSTGFVTDSSLDGLDEPASCTTTNSLDWSVVIPDLSSATSGMLMQIDGAGNAVLGGSFAAIFSDPAFTISTTGLCTVTSPCISLNMANANTWTGAQTFTGTTTFTGVVDFSSSTSIRFPFTAGKYGLWWTDPTGLLQRFDFTGSSTALGQDLMVNPAGTGLMVAGDFGTGGAINTGTLIPGINGQTIVASSVREWLTKIFYQSSGPVVNLSIGNSVLEMGATTTNTVTYTAIRKTSPISASTLTVTACDGSTTACSVSTSTVLGVNSGTDNSYTTSSGSSCTGSPTTFSRSDTPTSASHQILVLANPLGIASSSTSAGYCQSGTRTVTAFSNATASSTSVTSTFTIRASDILGAAATLVAKTVTYEPKVYAFVSANDYIFGSFSDSTISSDILAAANATTCAPATPTTGCSALQTTHGLTFKMTPSSQYVYYAYPVTFGGISNTAITSNGGSVHWTGGSTGGLGGIGAKTLSMTNGATTPFTQDYYLYAFPEDSGNAGHLPTPASLGGLTGTYIMVAP